MNEMEEKGIDYDMFTLIFCLQRCADASSVEELETRMNFPNMDSIQAEAQNLGDDQYGKRTTSVGEYLVDEGPR